MNTLTEIHQKIHALKEEKKILDADYEKESRIINQQIKGFQETIALASDALDIEKIKLAETIIFVRGNFSKAGQDRHYVLAKAISQFAQGNLASGLWHNYLGTKTYAHWHGQSVEPPYGMGPTHGSVIFSIGIADPVRKERTPEDLSPDEIEACIYYLGALEKIQQAKLKAA